MSRNENASDEPSGGEPYGETDALGAVSKQKRSLDEMERKLESDRQGVDQIKIDQQRREHELRREIEALDQQQKDWHWDFAQDRERMEKLFESKMKALEEQKEDVDNRYDELTQREIIFQQKVDRATTSIFRVCFYVLKLYDISLGTKERGVENKTVSSRWKQSSPTQKVEVHRRKSYGVNGPSKEQQSLSLEQELALANENFKDSLGGEEEETIGQSVPNRFEETQLRGITIQNSAFRHVPPLSGVTVLRRQAALLETSRACEPRTLFSYLHISRARFQLVYWIVCALVLFVAVILFEQARKEEQLWQQANGATRRFLLERAIAGNVDF